MKKSFFVAAMLLGAMTMSAAPYQHSIGITAGGLNGVEYKGFLNDHVVIAADLGVRLSQSQGMSWAISLSDKDAEDAFKQMGGKLSDSNNDVKFAYWTFEGAVNVAYQGTIKDWSAGSLQWFAGGGMSLGMVQFQPFGKYDGYYTQNPKTGKDIKNAGDAWKAMKDARKTYNDLSSDEKKYEMNPLNFKFGMNAYAGMEFAFSNVPLVLGMDFRPGLGMAINGRKWHDELPEKMAAYECDMIQTNAFFDWSLGVTLRYCL